MPLLLFIYILFNKFNINIPYKYTILTEIHYFISYIVELLLYKPQVICDFTLEGKLWFIRSEKKYNIYKNNSAFVDSS